MTLSPSPYPDPPRAGPGVVQVLDEVRGGATDGSSAAKPLVDPFERLYGAKGGAKGEAGGGGRAGGRAGSGGAVGAGKAAAPPPPGPRGGAPPPPPPPSGGAQAGQRLVTRGWTRWKWRDGGGR